MSKIICDVCGTSYPDSVNQCPICGCVRSVDSHVAQIVENEEVKMAATGTYNHVKGGRFSKANVKKRQKNIVYERQVEGDDEEELVTENEAETTKTDRGLLIAFIVLLLSVAAVVCYILVKFLSPQLLDPSSNKKPGVDNHVDNEPVITTEAAVEDLSCQDITLNQQTVTISEKSCTFQIEVVLTPADTEDAVVYTSSDNNIATVSETGLVTAVAPGEATITVSCGDVTKNCTVTCSFEVAAPTLPDVPQVDLPVVAAGFELNRSDFSLFKKGDTWNLYSGSIPENEITWTSSNPKVATVSKGKVTAVSAGKAVITAKYKDSKLTCTVYCKNSVGAYVETDNADTTDKTENSAYKLNTADRKNDISITVGSSYTLKLLDENGEAVKATFTSSDSDICTVSDGVVTGVAKGKVNVTASYDGQSFVCIVRVK